MVEHGLLYEALMIKKFTQLSTFISLSLLSGLVWANASLEDIADTLMTPTEIVTKLVVVASYAVGVGLIIFSIAQYKQHKQSPKLVPLTTPILLLILGICTLMIPYLSVISGESFSATEQAKREGRVPGKSGAFSPNVPEIKKRERPGPGRYAPSETRTTPVPQREESYEESYDNDYEPSYQRPGSDHWTKDPRYQR